MTESESWQVTTEAAEVYESCFVPAIFGAWAGRVADAAGITTGDRVLDVGCGTGVLAREALGRVGQEGQVVGLDLNEGMLAVAARTEPKIDWRQGDAASLPFEPASFDVVVSQFALMYFPDRVASLARCGVLSRQLDASDRLVGIHRPRPRLPAACGHRGAAMRTSSRRAGSAVRPWRSGRACRALCQERRLGAKVTLHEGSIRFASVKEFIRVEVKGSPLAEMVSDDVMRTLASESEQALAEFVVPSGEIVMPMDAHIATASKA